MDALDKLILNGGQQITIEVQDEGDPFRWVKITFGSEPSTEALEPIERLISHGATLEVYSTSKFKKLNLSRTVHAPDAVATALAETWRSQGMSVEESVTSPAV